MSMATLKAGVTKFFKSKKVFAANLKQNKIISGADFFELAILADIVAASKLWKPRNLSTIGGKQYYLVACSPTSNWLNGSRFEAQSSTGIRYAAKSGISVHLPDGSTTEIDVLIVNLSNVSAASSRVCSTDVVAGFECKAFSKRLQMPTIDAVIGKGCRVWMMPIPPVSGSTIHSFCLCSMLDVTANAQLALKTAGIAAVGNLGASQQPSLHRAKVLCQALGL